MDFSKCCFINTMFIALYLGPPIKAIADGPVGLILARSTFSQGKNIIPFYTKQVINKSARVIFGLGRLVIL